MSVRRLLNVIAACAAALLLTPFSGVANAMPIVEPASAAPVSSRAPLKLLPARTHASSYGWAKDRQSDLAAGLAGRAAVRRSARSAARSSQNRYFDMKARQAELRLNGR